MMNMAELAAAIARKASMPGAKLKADPVSDDESADESDEEEDLQARRQKAKATSQAIIENGCIPDHVQLLPTRKMPFASFQGLQKTMTVLAEITSQREARSEKYARKFTDAEILEAELEVAKAFSFASETPSGEGENLIPSRPERVKKNTTQLLAKAMSTAVDYDAIAVGAVAKRDTSSVTQVPPKLSAPRPAKRSQEALAVGKCPMFFCMDMCDDASSGVASARESSLARAYEVLGAAHCSLDDADDLTTCNAASRDSSLARQFDALGAGMGKSLQSPTSKPRRLPPVRPHSRGATLASKGPSKVHGAPSAMEMDLGLAGDGGSCLGSKSHFSIPIRSSHSLSSLHAPKTIPKKLPNVVLPALHRSSDMSESQLGSKSLFKMRSGPAGAPLWDVPLHGHSRQFDTRHPVF